MNPKKKKTLQIILTISAICICATLFFSFGAYYSCDKSNGVLLEDLTCIQITDQDYCIDNNTGLYKQTIHENTYVAIPNISMVIK